MIMHVYGRTLAEYRDKRNGKHIGIATSMNPVERAAAYCGVSKNTFNELVQKALSGEMLEPKLGARGKRGRYPRPASIDIASDKHMNESHSLNSANGVPMMQRAPPGLYEG